MSQSGKTLHEFGSITLNKDLRLKTGSTVSLSVSATPAHTSLGDEDSTLTVAQLKSGILVQTPTATRTLTLPTAEIMAASLRKVGDTLDFHVINLGADGIDMIVAAGTDGTNVGLSTVRDSTGASPESGSATFRVRQTDVDTPAYICYRLN